MNPYGGERGRLSKKSLILLSSIPHEDQSKRYPRVHDAHLEIQEAIVCLTRAVLYEKGRIVFSGNPAISLLLALIAGEYIQPRFAEGELSEQREERYIPPIAIYQTKYPEMFAEEMNFLESLGYISLQKDKDAYIFSETNPVAAVCIGGMEDVEHDLEMVLKTTENIPIYIIEKTGGAAGHIAGHAKEMQTFSKRIRVIDRELIKKLSGMRKELHKLNEFSELEREGEIIYESIPFASIMQIMIEEITHGELY